VTAALKRLAVAVAAAVAAAVAVMSLLAAGGCGGSSDSDEGSKTVEKTRVQVVEGLGENGFHPASIYERLSPGVVTITSIFGNGSTSDLLNGDGAAGQGSGFVIDDKGNIATNAHVITDGTGNKISKADEVYVQFADGNQVPAEIVGYDPNADVGLVKVDPKGLKLVPLSLGETGGVKVGDPVAAIGSPFGEENSLSVGVVSAKDRTIQALTDFSISEAIQTDAAINRGNSGGPLLNERGRVIGIITRIRSSGSGGGNVGVGFAVSVDTVDRSLDQIRSGGEVRYAYIGISSQPLYPQLADKLGLPVDRGALIADVVNGGPADKAGLKGGGKEIRFQSSLVKIGGDVITKVNGKRIGPGNDFSSLITRSRPGDRITLEIYRGGDRRTAEVTLTERPNSLSSK
jgi:S1-C subfamily serine protease